MGSKAGSKAGSKGRHGGRRGGRRGRTMLQLLGMAGLGFAASRLRRQGRASEPARDRRPRRRPRPVAVESPLPPIALPDAAELHWLPTPSGSVAVASLAPVESLAPPGASGSRRSRPGPVVYVHGLGGAMEHWSPQLLGATGGRLGLAVDLPGHGRSERPRGAVTIESLTDALDAVVTAAAQSTLDGALGDVALRGARVASAESTTRCLLVAHSFGALPALELAARAPHRVEGVLLVDPNGDQTCIPAAERRALLDTLRAGVHDELEWTWRQLLADSTPAVTESIVAQLRATPPPVLLDCLEAGLGHSPLPALDRLLDTLDVPVRLALSPLNDLPYSLHRLRPRLPLRVVPAGHWLMLDRPDDLVGMIDEFETV